MVRRMNRGGSGDRVSRRDRAAAKSAGPYAPGSATAPENGVGAASADGATLFALVVDADGGLAASAVDVATQAERLRVRVLDKGLIAVDIAECAAEG